MLIFQRQTKNVPSLKILSEAFEINASSGLNTEEKYKHGSLTLDDTDEIVKYAIRPITATAVQFDPQLFEWIDLSFNGSSSTHQVLAAIDGPGWEPPNNNATDPNDGIEHEVILSCDDNSLLICKKHLKEYASDIDSDVENERVKARQAKQLKIDRATEMTRLKTIQAKTAAQINRMTAEDATTTRTRKTTDPRTAEKTGSDYRKSRSNKKSPSKSPTSSDKNDSNHARKRSTDRDVRPSSYQSRHQYQGYQNRNYSNRRGSLNGYRGQNGGSFSTNNPYRSPYNRYNDRMNTGSVYRHDERFIHSPRNLSRDRSKSRDRVERRNPQAKTSSDNHNNHGSTTPLSEQEIVQPAQAASNATTIPTAATTNKTGPFMPIVPNNCLNGWDSNTCWNMGWTPPQIPPPLFTQPNWTRTINTATPAPNWTPQTSTLSQQLNQPSQSQSSYNHYYQQPALTQIPPSCPFTGLGQLQTQSPWPSQIQHNWEQAKQELAKPNMQLGTLSQQNQPQQSHIFAANPGPTPLPTIANSTLAQNQSQQQWHLTNHSGAQPWNQQPEINMGPVNTPPVNQIGLTNPVETTNQTNWTSAHQSEPTQLNINRALAPPVGIPAAPINTNPNGIKIAPHNGTENTVNNSLPLPQRPQFQTMAQLPTAATRRVLLPTPTINTGPPSTTQPDTSAAKTTPTTITQQTAIADAFQLAWQHFNTAAQPAQQQQQPNAGARQTKATLIMTNTTTMKETK